MNTTLTGRNICVFSNALCQRFFFCLPSCGWVGHSRKTLPETTSRGDATLAGICIRINSALIGRQQKRGRRLCEAPSQHQGLNKSPPLLLGLLLPHQFAESFFFPHQRGFAKKEGEKETLPLKGHRGPYRMSYGVFASPTCAWRLPSSASSSNSLRSRATKEKARTVPPPGASPPASASSARGAAQSPFPPWWCPKRRHHCKVGICSWCSVWILSNILGCWCVSVTPKRP